MQTLRSSKQCRERWCYILKPGLKKTEWTHEEDITMLNMQKYIGNQWAAISRRLVGRTDIDVKNRFSSLQRSRQNKPRQSKLSQTHDFAMENITTTANQKYESQNLNIQFELGDSKVEKLSTVESLNIIQKELELYPIPKTNSNLTIPFRSYLLSACRGDKPSSFAIPIISRYSDSGITHNDNCVQNNFSISRNCCCDRICLGSQREEEIWYVSIYSFFIQYFSLIAPCRAVSNEEFAHPAQIYQHDESCMHDQWIPADGEFAVPCSFILNDVTVI